MGDDLYLRIMLQAEDVASSMIARVGSSLIAMAESAAESGVSFDGLAASVDAATVSMEGIDTSLLGITASTDEAAAGIGVVDASLVSMGESADVVVAGMGGVDTALASVTASADSVVVGIGGVEVAASEFVVGMGGVTASADAASASIAKVGPAADASKASLGGIGLALAAVGIAAVAVGAKSVQMGADFQASMIKSQAEAGLTKQQMTDMGNAILQMAPQVGQAPKQLADGLFFVESAGFAGKDALDTLRLSAQMAANDMTDTSTVAKGLTTAVKAFGLQTSDSAMVANQMTVTVSSGKMTMADYAQSIGKTAQMAHQFKVGMSETNAALDTLTNNGFPSAATASTALQNVLQQFDGNTDKVTKNIKALGLSFNEQKFKSMDLGQQVQYLSTVMKGHEDQLQKVLGGSKSAALGFNALKGGVAGYQDVLQKLNGAQKNGGAEAQAFAATQQGFNFQMQQASAAAQSLMITIGSALLPVVTKLASGIGPLVTNFSNWLTKSGALQATATTLGNAFSFIGNVLGTLGTAIGNTIAFFQKHQTAMNALKAVLIGIGVAVLVFAATAIPPLLNCLRRVGGCGRCRCHCNTSRCSTLHLGWGYRCRCGLWNHRSSSALGADFKLAQGRLGCRIFVVHEHHACSWRIFYWGMEWNTFRVEGRMECHCQRREDRGDAASRCCICPYHCSSGFVYLALQP
jgi:TP901 family phage tail tape measure protein